MNPGLFVFLSRHPIRHPQASRRPTPRNHILDPHILAHLAFCVSGQVGRHADRTPKERSSNPGPVVKWETRVFRQLTPRVRFPKARVLFLCFFVLLCTPPVRAQRPTDTSVDIDQAQPRLDKSTAYFCKTASIFNQNRASPPWTGSEIGSAIGSASNLDKPTEWQPTRVQTQLLLAQHRISTSPPSGNRHVCKHNYF